MTYILSSLLVLFNYFYGISKKHNKILAFLLVLFSWILFWGNNLNPDYQGYQLIYYSNGNIRGSIEVGFLFLIKIGNILGLKYEIFLLILSFCGFVIIHREIKRYTSNYNYVYVLYFLFPFFFDIIQIRNFLFLAFFLYAIRYLLNGSKFKYCLIIILTSLIHTISLAYLPLVLINVNKKNMLIRLITILSIFTSIIILLNNKEIPMMNEIMNIIKIEKLLIYMDSKTNFGYLLFFGTQILSYFMMVITRKVFIRYENNENNLSYQFISLTLWINIVSFIFFPLYIINSNFSRIMRNILFLNYISLAITTDKISQKKEKASFNILVLLYIFILFISQMFPYIDIIIRDIMENNIIF